MWQHLCKELDFFGELFVGTIENRLHTSNFPRNVRKPLFKVAKLKYVRPHDMRQPNANPSRGRSSIG